MKRENGKANKNSTLETSNTQESHIACTKKEKTIDQIKRKRLLSFCCGKVAQLVEQPAHIRSVTGPSPVLAITIPYGESFFLHFFYKKYFIISVHLLFLIETFFQRGQKIEEKSNQKRVHLCCIHAFRSLLRGRQSDLPCPYGTGGRK